METNVANVYAFSGKFGSGKDTAADILQASLTSVANVSFAYELKRIISLLDGRNLSLYTDEEKKMQPNPLCDAVTFGKIVTPFLETVYKNLIDQPLFLFKLWLHTSLYWEKATSMGEILQLVGTNVFRKYIENDVWLNLAKPKILENLKNGINVIIRDCRFRNEATMIKSMGGKIIRIECPIETRMSRIKTPRDPNHISETDLDEYKDFYVTINNNGTLQDLENSIKNSLLQ